SSLELAAACEQRRGPARSHEEEDHRRDGSTRRNGERDGEGERKDREEQDLVHVRMLHRIDREAKVVEVEKAAAEARAERPEEALASWLERDRRDRERNPGD